MPISQNSRIRWNFKCQIYFGIIYQVCFLWICNNWIIGTSEIICQKTPAYWIGIIFKNYFEVITSWLVNSNKVGMIYLINYIGCLSQIIWKREGIERVANCRIYSITGGKIYFNMGTIILGKGDFWSVIKINFILSSIT